MVEAADLAKSIAQDLRPDGGWWHDPSTSVDLSEIAESLITAGATASVVRDALNRMVGVIANEYGD